MKVSEYDLTALTRSFFYAFHGKCYIRDQGEFAIDKKERFKLKTILEIFQKSALPKNDIERRYAANAICVLKERVKLKYYSSVCGFGRWLLAIFFSCLRFENREIGKEFAKVEKRLGQTLKSDVEKRELYLYTKRAKIALPNGCRSKKQELIEAIRAHWLIEYPVQGNAPKNRDIPDCLKTYFEAYCQQELERTYLHASFSELLDGIRKWEVLNDQEKAIWEKVMPIKVKEQIDTGKIVAPIVGRNSPSFKVFVECIKQNAKRIDTFVVKGFDRGGITNFDKMIYRVEKLELPYRVNMADFALLMDHVLCCGSLRTIKEISYTHITSQVEYTPVEVELLKHPEYTWEVRFDRVDRDEVLTWKVRGNKGTVGFTNVQKSTDVELSKPSYITSLAFDPLNFENTSTHKEAVAYYLKQRMPEAFVPVNYDRPIKLNVG